VPACKWLVLNRYFKNTKFANDSKLKQNFAGLQKSLEINDEKIL